MSSLRGQIATCLLSRNMRLVLIEHPELMSEYQDKASRYYKTPNGENVREALRQADHLLSEFNITEKENK